MKRKRSEFDQFLHKGIARLKLGEHKEAIEDFSKAIELGGKNVKAYINRGGARFELGEHKEAIEDFSKAIELDGKNVRAYINRGGARFELGEHKEAIEDFSKAIELDGKNVEAYINRGGARFELGEHKEAIEDFSKAIELDGKNVEAYIDRGGAKFKVGERKEAIEDFSKAIELDGKNVRVYINRGVVKFELGEHKEAIEDFSKAIELDGKNVRAYIFRGGVRFELGKHKEAIEDFSKAIELNERLIKTNFPCFLIHSLKEIRQKDYINLFLKLYFEIDSFKRKNCIVKDETIYHYTGTDTLKKLIKGNKQLRLYSSIGMNDSNEGKHFLGWLKKEFSKKTYEDIIKNMQHENNFKTYTYVLSFVGEGERQKDNLIHWRSYGKSEGIDCNGVNLGFNKNDFNSDLDAYKISYVNSQVHSKTSQNLGTEGKINKNPNEYKKENFVLMKVIYLKEDSKYEKDLQPIKESIEEICTKFLKTEDLYYKKTKELLSVCLDEIRFLIKDESYESENEVRLIYREYGNNMSKCDEELRIPRLYVEYPEKGIPKSIMLGPKIEKRDQWREYLQYHYKSDIKVEYSKIKFN